MRLLGNGGFLSSTLTCVAAWHDRPTKGSASFLAWVSLGHFLAPPMDLSPAGLEQGLHFRVQIKPDGTVQMERPTHCRVCRGSPVGSWRRLLVSAPGLLCQGLSQTCSVMMQSLCIYHRETSCRNVHSPGVKLGR